MRSAAAVILFALGLSVLLYLAAADRTQAQVQLSPTPRSIIVIDLPPDGGAEILDLPYPQLDAGLNILVQEVQNGLLTAQAAAARSPLNLEESVAVTLYFEDGNASSVIAHLTERGADPRNVGSEYIEAYVPVALLPDMSNLPEVDFVAAIVPPQPAQITPGTEGVVAHQVAPWHDAGYKGQGIKVGVIDIGFKGLVSHPNLPDVVYARCYREIGRFTNRAEDCGSSDHGTGVVEALYSIAPEARYYITNGGSFADTEETIDWMADEGVSVLNISLGYRWVGPGDGTSFNQYTILQLMDYAVSKGIVVIASAGNGARGNWHGPFSDPDNDGWLNFDGETECNPLISPYQEGISTYAVMRWDDSWGGSSTDLSIHIYDSRNPQLRLVAASNHPQHGLAFHTPFEHVSWAHPPNSYYCVAIRYLSGRRSPNWVQLQVPRGVMEINNPSRSIGTPAESANPGLLTAGASKWDNNHTIADYSSRGPTADGRIKPDITGASEVHSQALQRLFGGTSQASPFIAGLAALVKQRAPWFTPAQTALYLKMNASPRGRVPNNTWGYGFGQLPSPTFDIHSPTPTPTITPTPTSMPHPLPTPSTTPTATPSPTPTATPPPDPCLEAIESDNSWEGTWNDDCPSTNRGGSYARYYSFMFDGSADMTITLESTADPYLFLLQGAGREGVMLYENDDIEIGSDTNSRITQALSAGEYTIEATTYSSGETGEFTLTVTGLPMEGAPTPTPTQTPTPTPEPTVTPGPTPEPTPVPPGGISQYGCTADDLEGVVGSYTQHSTEGPGASGEPSHHGIQEVYSTTWVNEDSGVEIECRAVRYDSLGNARWTGLNYSAVLDRLNVDLNIGDHAQVFASTKVDGGLSYWLQYVDEGGEIYSVVAVKFLDLANLTVVQVAQIYIGDEEYIGTATDEVDGVARRIWERVAGRN